MPSTTFGVRYKSPVTPGKLVYATGAGTEEDPYKADLKLSGNGAYLLFIHYYKATGEGDLSLSVETKHPEIADWFPVNLNDGTPLVAEIPGVENELSRLRSPFFQNGSTLIYQAESEIRLNFFIEGDQKGGWLVAQVVSATEMNPIAPHIVQGFTRIPVGSIRVDTVDNRGGWKFLHESSFHASGEIVTDLGVGSHLITFDEEAGYVPPQDQFVVVSDDTTTILNAEYSPE